MVDTSSTMLPLGLPAPDFRLPGVTTGQQVELSHFKGNEGLLVIFLSRHCPFVKHVQQQIAAVGNDYLDRGLGVVAISSNNVEKYPADAPEKLKEMATELEFSFPLLYDAKQDAAKAYKAACTPDFFLFDGKLNLAYRGQLDDSRPGNDKPVDGKDLRTAIEAILEGQPVPHEQRPSMGCNIKWKPGNEPEYFLT